MTRAGSRTPRRSLRDLDLLWVQRVGQTALYGALAVLVAVGLRTLFTGAEAAQTPPPPDPTLGFPVTEGGAFAARFTTDWLTWEADQPQARDSRLAGYLASGLDDRAGWNGVGSQTADSPVVVSIEPASATRAVATVAARVVSAERVRWVHLAVPVAAEDGRFAVTALPALTPAPSKADVRTASPRADEALSRQVTDTVGAWCRAYAQGDRTELAYLAAEGVELSALGAGWRCVGVASVTAVEGDGPSRQVLADVVLADDLGAAVEGTYAMTMVQAGSRWYLADSPTAYTGE